METDRPPWVAYWKPNVCDDLNETLLVQQFIDERNVLRDNLIEDHTPCRCLDGLAVNANFDTGVETNS
ncbi:MAG: hypothetical protein HW389_2289, partial [Bacteroidetes bacterium]|nr:hypothetical protein [Bacteroidota bacterium]